MTIPPKFRKDFIGIPKQEASRIVERFKQATATPGYKLFWEKSARTGDPNGTCVNLALYTRRRHAPKHTF